MRVDLLVRDDDNASPWFGMLRHTVHVCERMKSLKFQCESFLVVGTPEVTLTQVAAGCVNG